MSKASDGVNHFKLFNYLLDADVPFAVVEVLCNWYAKMFVVIRWNDSLTRMSDVESGVRQGSTWSPSIFNVFMIYCQSNIDRCWLSRQPPLCWMFSVSR